jgi:hypothetical protein
MPSFRMLRRVACVTTDVSEERIASIIRVTRIEELGTEARSEEIPHGTSVHTRATRYNIQEDGILDSHCREHLRSDTRKSVAL